MTYKQFEESNNTSKRIGVQPVGRIEAVDFKFDRCKLAVYDNVSIVGIPHLINDITRDGMGCISNPSALRNWRGWDR